MAHKHIIRGRDAYCVPKKRLSLYNYQYCSQTMDLASYMKEKYPKIDFRIFETVQLNVFLNQLIGRNTIFLSVEEDLGSFIFDELRNRYDNNVLLYPDEEIYYQYWKEDVIIVEKLPSESPRGQNEFWNTCLEKMLVDIMSDKLMMHTFSESEYLLIYETAFENYIIDESQMFRYARRRNAAGKLMKYLKDNTSVKLRTR